jgi:hypothetical protein
MSMIFRPNMPIPGLILYYDGFNSKSLTNVSSTWYDLMANSDITSVSCSSNFVSVNSYNVRIPNNGSFSSWFSNGDFSIMTISNCEDEDYPRSYHPFKLGSTVTNDTDVGFSIGHQQSKNSFEFRARDTVGNFTSSFISHPSALVLNRTYLRCFTVSRNNGIYIKYYSDGAFVGNLNFENVTGSLYGGVQDYDGWSWGDVWGWRYIGKIYSIAIWRKELTPNEISDIYSAFKGRYGL